MKYVTPSRAYRQHMLAIDIAWAVYAAIDHLPDLANARSRLGVLLPRLEAHIGPKNREGGWCFSSEAHWRSYKHALQGVMAAVVRQGQDEQDGLRWFIAALGLGESAYDSADEAGKAQLAHAWRLVLRVIGWMFSVYEEEPWANDSYVPGLELMDEIKRESGTWT